MGQRKKERPNTMKKERSTAEVILLRGEEVADLLGVSRAKAYRMMATRQIPVVTFGKAVRCPRESLLKFIAEKTEQPTRTV
jgi:excisionase family DNA binding protein